MRAQNNTRPMSRWLVRVGMLILAGLLLGGCTDGPSILDPQGPKAAQVAVIWWIMFGLGTAVFVAVMVALGYALWRGRRSTVEDRPRPSTGNTVLVLGGVVVPLIVLIVLIVMTAYSQRTLFAAPSPPSLTIDVIAHQFWWEVRYPQYQVVTATEIHLPIGQPVEIRLTSADVIHSFWVPQIDGKLDNHPGRTNVLWFQADQPGVYRGFCAEFCGVQHALMPFLVIAESPDSFAAWLDQRRAPPPPQPVEPLLQRGQRVYLQAGCSTCHAIQGVAPEPPTGTVGPDLTHLGSRRTLASGILDNTPENLASWIINPQAIKPGNRMPSTPLSQDDLAALVAYLLSLR